MFKKLITFSATLITTLLMAVSGAMASGKMEVPLGQQLMLQAENLQTGVNFKWVTTKDKQILSAQSGSVFTYTFDLQGEYLISLSAEEASGNIKTTTLSVMVGDRYSKTGAGATSGENTIDSPLRAAYSTLPTMDSSQILHILGDEGRVAFDIEARPDVLEYRIDRNVFIDSDGNGIANDDIDNATDDSYLLAGVWETTYKAQESNRIAAEVTVVNSAGQKAKNQVEIIFDSFIPNDGSTVAVLDSLPFTSPVDNKIYVYDEADSVAFYARRSQGDLIEYRIDKNIFEDSDGDGNPSNDIDNRNDPSFRSGDVWVTNYQKTGEQIIAQLIVVNRAGTGSRIQREIIFTNRPVPEVVTASDSVIALTTDKEFVQKGDPINFSVQGLTQDLGNYIFEWDFNGDDQVDQTIEGSNTVSYIYDTPGIASVKVRVQDLDQNEARFSKDVLVKDVSGTQAGFDFVVNGQTVAFNNLSTVSQVLSNKLLNYAWSFGDTDEENYLSQQDQTTAQNPTYNYTKAGNYIVTLTVTDSDQVTNTYSTEITVGDAVEGVNGQNGAEVQEENGDNSPSLIGRIFKVILYLILTVLALLLLTLGGLLIFLKIKHPDLVFEELIDEMKTKILSLLGVSEFMEPPSQTPPVATPMPAKKPEPELKKKQDEAPFKAPEPRPMPSTPTPDLTKSDGPVPEWMKSPTPAQVSPVPKPAPKKEVIEGEVVQEGIVKKSAPVPTPAPVPPKPFVPPTPPSAPAAPKPVTPVVPSPVVTPMPAPAPIPAQPGPPKPPIIPAANPTAGTQSPTGGAVTPPNPDLTKPDGPVPDWLKNA